MYFAFNELSVHSNIRTSMSREIARQRINEFIELLHLLKSKDLMKGLISTSDIHDFMVTKDYGINEWLNDCSVNRNHKQFFRTLCSQRCTYVQANNFMNEFNVCINKEVYNGIGCLIAIETNNSVVSTLSNDYWKKKVILGQYITMDEEGNLISSEKSVKNISTVNDVSMIRQFVVKQIHSNISSGQDLWEQREFLFPKLIFCESVKDQLYKDPEKFHILNIMEKLQRVQEYFETYGGIYDPKILGLNARTESNTVKSSKILKAMRLFRKPNGDEEYFYDHIGFSGKFSGGRIYFLPDDKNRKCYIGYIGRHLPTKNF